MFTGIIEDLGKINKLEKDGGNLQITVSTSFTNELKIDQSVAHNGVCLTVVGINGDAYTVFRFEYDKNLNNITIEKGSITVNGVSLTVVNSLPNSFSVAIIPYTYNHTTFKNLKIKDSVNLEFDVIGKYVKRLNDLRH